MSLIKEAQKLLGVNPDGGWGRITHDAFLQKLGLQPVAPTTAIPPRTTAMLYQGSAEYPVNEIVVHCTATTPQWKGNEPFAARFAEIRRWHMVDRGWKDIGYHYLIDRDGSVLAGRPETTIGAGVEGHNRGVIHISLLGGHDSSASDPFDRNFTAAQDRALRGAIQAVSTRTQITKIAGHNEYAAKACPGFDVDDWYN